MLQVTRIVREAWVVDDRTIVDGKVALLKHFEGPSAEVAASRFIETLPDFLSGRYGLDVAYEDDLEE